ncbi:hypothetical protein Hamer_G010901 [Homarus americanus]|uniref:Uncharacterized protein n=1 Tax=Homarus americanus TaxID=6706 RepID=A0A8J5JQ23_HOMAM|nr:hypothetical protein Hamer_G010901 [Homarus americanus]
MNSSPDRRKYWERGEGVVKMLPERRESEGIILTQLARPQTLATLLRLVKKVPRHLCDGLVLPQGVPHIAGVLTILLEGRDMGLQLLTGVADVGERSPEHDVVVPREYSVVKTLGDSFFIRIMFAHPHQAHDVEFGEAAPCLKVPPVRAVCMAVMASEHWQGMNVLVHMLQAAPCDGPSGWMMFSLVKDEHSTW